MKRVRPADRPDPGGIRWIIKPLVRQRSVGVVFGPSGVGKSTLQVDLACSVAALPEWRGHKVRGGPVAIIAGEDPDGIHMMLHAWEWHHGAERVPVEVIEGPVNLFAEIDAVIAELLLIRDDHGELALVIIDTLASVWPEESNEAMILFLQYCRRIIDETGASVLITHHSGKDQTRGERGGSALRCGVDLSIEVTRDGEVGAAEVAKVRGAVDGKVHGYKLAVVELGADEDGDAITACTIEGAAAPIKVRPLGTNAQIVLQTVVLLNQIAEHPNGLPVEMVREQATRRFTTKNPWQAFTRALSELQKNPHYVRVLDGHITLSPDVEIPPELRRSWEELHGHLH